MGLSDRDYMRERARERFDNERPFRPPESRLGLPWMILFWVAVAFILFKLYANYAPVLQKDPRTVQVQPTRQHVPPLEAPHQEARPPSVPERQITHTATTRVVIQQAPGAPAAVAPGSNTIYLCRAYNGGAFWSQAHCNQHNALIDRIAYVPPHLPFDQQVSIAQQQRSNAALVQSTTTVTSSTNDAGPAAQHGQCDALEARIRQLDAMARAPQSPQMQDWIAAQRKEARDRQFRLRC